MEGLHKVPYHMVKLALKSIRNKNITNINISLMNNYLLLNMDSVEFLQDIIRDKETENNNMSQKEAIRVIAYFGGGIVSIVERELL